MSVSNLIKLLFLTFVLKQSNAHAQDLIITTKKDSINCKLIAFNKFDSVAYLYYLGGLKVVKKMSSNEVQKIQTNFYVEKLDKMQDSIENIEVKKGYFQLINNKNYFKANQFRFSFEYLYSYNVLPHKSFLYLRGSNWKENQKLHDFYGYNIDLCYAVNQANNFFIGVLYNQIKLETFYNDVAVLLEGDNITSEGPVERKTEMNTIGLKGMFLFPSKRAFNNLYLILGANFTNYKDEYFTTNSYLNLQSAVVAPFLGLSYDFRFHKNLAAGVSLLLEYGAITEINSNHNGKLQTFNLQNDAISIVRLTSGMGLKYYFGK